MIYYQLLIINHYINKNNLKLKHINKLKINKNRLLSLTDKNILKRYLILFKRLNNQKSGRPLISNMSDDDLKKFISMKLSEREKFYEQADYKYLQKEDNDTPIELEKFITEKLQRSRS